MVKAMHISEKSLVCNMQCNCILPRILVLQICASRSFHERVNTMQGFEETEDIHIINLKRMCTNNYNRGPIPVLL